MPLPVKSQLVPCGGNTFGILEDTHLIGGWRVVNRLKNLAELHPSKLKIGMRAVVLEDCREYELTKNGWQPLPEPLSIEKLYALLQVFFWQGFADRDEVSKTTFFLPFWVQNTLPKFVFLNKIPQYECSDYEISRLDDGRTKIQFTDREGIFDWEWESAVLQVTCFVSTDKPIVADTDNGYLGIDTCRIIDQSL